MSQFQSYHLYETHALFFRIYPLDYLFDQCSHHGLEFCGSIYNSFPQSSNPANSKHRRMHCQFSPYYLPLCILSPTQGCIYVGLASFCTGLICQSSTCRTRYYNRSYPRYMRHLSEWCLGLIFWQVFVAIPKFFAPFCPGIFAHQILHHLRHYHRTVFEHHFDLSVLELVTLNKLDLHKILGTVPLSSVLLFWL